MVKGAKYMVTEGDSALGGQHTAQYTDNALKNHILETYIIYQPVSPDKINQEKMKK